MFTERNSFVTDTQGQVDLLPWPLQIAAIFFIGLIPSWRVT